MKHWIDQLMKNKVRRTIALVLAIFVTFVTSYSLVLPAITLDQTIAEDMPGLDLGLQDEKDDARSVSEIEKELLAKLFDANYTLPDSEPASEAPTGIADAPAESPTETITVAEPTLEPNTVTVAEPTPEPGTVISDATDKLIFFDTVVKDTVDGELQTIQVHVEAPAKALPENTSMTTELVKDADILETIEGAVDGKNIAAVRAVSLSFRGADGEDISPKKDIQVTITTDADTQDAEPLVVQYLQKQNTTETVELQTEPELQAEPETALELDQAVTFETKEPAVYAVVYTVDFHYDVDGVEYVYSIDGGSGIALSELLRIIGMAADDPATPQDEVRAFIADIESVTFSNPMDVWVGQAADTTTIGALKQDNGLIIRYSAELTQERIENINAQTVQKSDWALISLRDFDTQESLTITMKNGDVYTVRVTDAASYPYTQVTDVSNLDGVTVVLYNSQTTINNETNTRSVLQSTPTTDNNPKRLAAAGATVNTANQTLETDATLTEWTFKKVPNMSGNYYYIQSGDQYLNMTRFSDTRSDLTISDTPQALEIVIDSTNHPGQIRIRNDSNHLVTQGSANGAFYGRPDSSSYLTWFNLYDISQQTPPTPDPDVLSASVTKDVIDNGDGTNTIQLDVTGHSIHRSLNMLIVLDVTTSMGSGAGSKWENSLSAMQELITVLTSGDDTNPYGIDFSLVTFGRSAQLELTNGDVWTDDVEEFRNTCANVSHYQDAGTNWESGLRAALDAMSQVPDADPTVVIFMTDGAPNTWYDSGPSTYYGTEYTYPGYSNSSVTAEQHADDEAAALTALPNTYLYGIYIFPGTELDTDPTGEYRYFARLESIIDYSNGVEAIAATAASIENEFTAIAHSALADMGPQNVTVYDGVTDLAVVKATGGVVDFSYFISDDNGATWTSWAQAPPASYDPDSDEVKWDLSLLGAVTDNYRYRVQFVVWPSQEAYDLIADVNNGVIHNQNGTTSKGTPQEAYNALPQKIKDQLELINGVYRLKTNTHLNIGYTYNGESYDDNGTTDHEGRLPLPPQQIQLQKEWINHLDSYVGSEVDIWLYQDGNPYLVDDNAVKIIAVDANNQQVDPRQNPESIVGWRAKDSIYVSCGLISRYVNGQSSTDGNNGTVTYVIEETGHDYTMVEPEYHWDLSSSIYRPMVINGDTTVILVRDDTVTAPTNGSYVVDGTTLYEGIDYYEIEGHVYRVVGSGNNTILVTNTRRSNLNLIKTVVDAAGNPITRDQMDDPNQLFTFNITVNEAKGETVYFSVLRDPDDLSTIVTNLQVNGAVAESESGVNTGYFHVDSGSTFTVSMQAGWNLRFTNLPIGSTYTITETNLPALYSFYGMTIDNGETITVSGTTGTGTIESSDHQITITCTNRVNAQQVNILKTDPTGETPLPGATFSLYGSDYMNGTTVNPNATALKTNLISDDNGRIDLGQLVYGTYYLVETHAPDGYQTLTRPVTITADATGVTCTQSEISLPQGVDRVTYDEQTGVYTAIVANDPGVELPATGGIGTQLFEVLGTILFLTSGAILLWRKRRTE